MASRQELSSKIGRGQDLVESRESPEIFFRILPRNVARLKPLTHALYQEFIPEQSLDILIFHRDVTRPEPPESILKQGLIVRALVEQKPHDLRTTVADSMESSYIQDLVDHFASGYVVVMRVPRSDIMFHTEPNYRKVVTTGSPIARYNPNLYGPLPEALTRRPLCADEYYAHVPPSQILGFYIKR